MLNLEEEMPRQPAFPMLIIACLRPILILMSLSLNFKLKVSLPPTWLPYLVRPFFFVLNLNFVSDSLYRSDLYMKGNLRLKDHIKILIR
jgi:hypothetical protein